MSARVRSPCVIAASLASSGSIMLSYVRATCDNGRDRAVARGLSGFLGFEVCIQVREERLVGRCDSLWRLVGFLVGEFLRIHTFDRSCVM